MFGPVGTFDHEVADEDFKSAPLSQPSEITEAIGWPNRVQSVASAIKVPVIFSLSEFDALWESSPDKVTQASGMYTIAARRGAGATLCRALSAPASCSKSL
jgi:hypothetical protein